ncbi:unnamed protein product, partial [Musa banksii]
VTPAGSIRASFSRISGFSFEVVRELSKETCGLGVFNQLKSFKHSPVLQSVIVAVQPQKVKFQLRLGQSEPIYDAIKIVQNSSSWPIILYRACKRTVEGNMSHLITKYRFFEVLSCSFTYDLHRRAMSFMLLCTVRQTLILLR